MSNESVDLFTQKIQNRDLLAAEISSMWERWESAKHVREQIIDEVDQYLYATSTENTENDKNDHSHTTHRPKLTQIYDNLKANYVQGLMPNERWFQFEGEDEKGVSKDVKDSIEAYLRTKHRQSGFRADVVELVDDWLMGDAFAQVVYVNEKHRLPDTDEEVQGYVGPKVLRISPRDIVFNPMARSFKRSPKIVRSIKTIGEAARDVEERPDSQYIREAWDEVMELRSTARGMKHEDIDKAAQMQLDGFGDYSNYITGENVEFLEFYGDIYDLDKRRLMKNHMITVIDRLKVLRSQPVDTWNGNPLIFHARYRKRRNNLWGMGALENLLGMQYYINHLENAKADAFDDMLVPDRVVAGDVDEVLGEKGEITYYVPVNGDVKNLAPDSTVLNADFKINEIEEKMEAYAGAPREAIGVRTPGEKTKFEVAELANARGRFFQHNMSEFESDMLEDIINAEVFLARKYLANRKERIKVDDDSTGAKLFQQLGKEDLTANGKLIPKGASHFSRKQQLAQNLIQLQSQILATDQEMAQHYPSLKLARLWEEILEFEEFNIVQPFGRVPEQMQLARLQQAAQSTLQQEGMVDLEDEGDEVSDVGTEAASP